MLLDTQLPRSNYSMQVAGRTSGGTGMPLDYRQRTLLPSAGTPGQFMGIEVLSKISICHIEACWSHARALYLVALAV